MRCGDVEGYGWQTAISRLTGRPRRSTTGSGSGTSGLACAILAAFLVLQGATAARAKAPEPIAGNASPMSVVYEKLRAASTAGNATGTLPSPNRFQLAQSGISGEQEDKRDYLAAASDGSEAALQDYLRKHPQGAYAQDVRDRIAALTGVKPTAPSTERGNLLILPGEPELLFEAPLRTGPYPVNGKSLQELAKGSPLFSPIEGLPDEVWKGKKCTNCHHWDKVTLCDQGTVYARNEPAHMLRKQHPYGGPFKLALRNWAEAGCK